MFSVFTPNSSGQASPVFQLWNVGDLVPAVYMAGRWKAAMDWYNNVMPQFGWDGDGNRKTGIDNMDNVTPFWGNVMTATYPR